MDDRASLTRFPKMAHFIDKNIAEIIIISRGIALQLMGLLCGYIKTEKAITCCSYQQMPFVFLNDIVYTRHALSSIHLHMDKLVVGIIIQVESFRGTHPQVALRITEKESYNIAANGGWVVFVKQICLSDNNSTRINY